MIGRIYKITSTEGNEIYIGSTYQCLKRRFVNHKTDASNSKILFDKYGYDTCNIELIKEYEVVDEYHILAYEQLWMNRFKNQIVNNKNAMWFEIVWRETNRETRKEYYEANKERKKEYQKEWSRANKEKRKEYYEANKERIKEYHKEWRQANKERIKEQKRQKTTCGCGSEYTKRNKTKHERTKKHQKWLKNLETSI